VLQTAEPVGPRATELFVQEATGWAGERDEEDDALPLHRRPRVLIVDANPDLRQYLTRRLAGAFDVEAAGDGVQALARIRSSPPELVISDVMMRARPADWPPPRVDCRASSSASDTSPPTTPPGLAKWRG
jgi:hypothetical protein